MSSAETATPESVDRMRRAVEYFTGRGMYLVPLKGKNPGAALGKGWQAKATNDPQTMAAHLSAGRRNIGVYLPASKLACLDIDNKDGLAEQRRQYFEARGVGFTTGLVVKSGRGGYHVYFANPDGLSTRDVETGIGEGAFSRTEFRSNGQQVLPPSVHPDTGQIYRLISHDEPSRLPDWAIRAPSTVAIPGATKRQMSPELVDGNYDTAMFSRMCATWAQGDADPEQLYVMYHALDQSHEDPLGPTTIRQKVESITTKYDRGTRAVARAGSIGSAVNEARRPTEDAVALMPGELAQALDAIAEVLRRFIHLSNADAIVVALWVTNTWVFDYWDVTPYLLITAPQKGSGKSNLLTLVRRLSRDGIISSDMSPSVLFRLVEQKHGNCTMCVDEVDTIWGSTRGVTERQEQLRAVLNGGYSRETGKTHRADDHGKTLKEFATYCPKALCGIATKLPDTIVDRSLHIRMEMATPAELATLVLFESDAYTAATTPIAHQLDTIAEGIVLALSHLGRAVDLPQELTTGRQRDLWRPLIALADIAGGRWPASARGAAKNLKPENDSYERQLLRDIRACYTEMGNPDRLQTSDIRDYVLRLDHGYDWPNGQENWALSTFLGRYDVHSHQYRVDGARTRGFYLNELAPVFHRYLDTDE